MQSELVRYLRRASWRHLQRRGQIQDKAWRLPHYLPAFSFRRQSSFVDSGLVDRALVRELAAEAFRALYEWR